MLIADYKAHRHIVAALQVRSATGGDNEMWSPVITLA